VALRCEKQGISQTAALVFFLYRHFTLAQEKDLEDEQQKLDDEKKDIMKRLSEAKKSGADKSSVAMLQQELQRMG